MLDLPSEEKLEEVIYMQDTTTLEERDCIADGDVKRAKACIHKLEKKANERMEARTKEVARLAALQKQRGLEKSAPIGHSSKATDQTATPTEQQDAQPSTQPTVQQS